MTRAANRLAYVLGAWIAATWAVAQPMPPLYAQGSRSANDWLALSMARHRVTTATLLQWQSVAGESSRVMVRIDQDSAGRRRRTILQPLRMQGLVVVDDGKQWMMLMPDQRKFAVQPSPSARAMAPADRMNLIERNYRLEVGEAETVAGRSAVVIVARPNSRGVPTRRLYLDERTGLPLRTEWSTAGGEAATVLDTVSAEYPRSLPSTLFSMEPPRGFDRFEMPVALRVSSQEDVERMVGFSPWIPSNWPFGLVVESTDVLRQPPQRMVVRRLTDGFMNLTLYQWPFDSSSHVRVPGDERPILARGLQMILLGDAPKAVLARVRSHILRASRP